MALAIIFAIIDIILAIVLTSIVLLQSGKEEGLSSVIGGGKGSFLAKNKAKTLDAKLSKSTKYVAAAFILVTLILNFIVS